MIWPWLIAGLSSLAGTIATARSQKKAREQQIADRDLNYQRYLENRNYNEPINQRARLMEAGLSPFSQSFSNTSSSAFDAGNITPAVDSFANLAQGFSNFAKTGYEKHLAKERQKLNLQLQKERLDLAREQLAATQNYRNGLLAYQQLNLQNRKFEFGVKRDQWAQSFGFNKKKFDFDKEKFERSFQFKKDFYTDSNYLGYWQKQNVINQIGYRDALRPYQIEALNLANEYKRIQNKYAPSLFSQDVAFRGYRNAIAKDNANKSRNEWRLYRDFYPQRRELYSLQMDAAANMQNYLAKRNYSFQEYFDNLMKVNQMFLNISKGLEIQTNTELNQQKLNY